MSGLLLLLGVAAAYVVVLGDPLFLLVDPKLAKGVEVDRHNGVAVYDNGPVYAKSYGRHYADDGTYFGQRWQCVEFIKRYLYLARGHRMPDGMGHAKDFFDTSVAHGTLNAKRGMLQFVNGGSEPPQVDDLIVFGGWGGYGHVAIVSAVHNGRIEVIQQNIYGRPRQSLDLTRRHDGQYEIPGAAGWLRVPRAPEI